MILQEKDHKKHQKLWPPPWSNFTLSLYYWNITNTVRLHFLNPQDFPLPFFCCLLLSHCGVRGRGEVRSGWVGAQLRGGTHPPKEYRAIADSPFQHGTVEISLNYSSERKITLNNFLRSRKDPEIQYLGK